MSINDQLLQLLSFEGSLGAFWRLKDNYSRQHSPQEFLNVFVASFNTILQHYIDNQINKKVCAKAGHQLENFCRVVQQLPERNEVLRKMFLVVLDKLGQSETHDAVYVACGNLFRIMIKVNQLSVGRLVNVLINAQNNNDRNSRGIILTLGQVARHSKLELHQLLSPTLEQQIRGLVFSSKLDTNLLQEIDAIIQAFQLRFRRPCLKPVCLLSDWNDDNLYSQSHIVQVSYDRSTATLFTGGYDCRLQLWDCVPERESVKKVIQFREQQIVSLNWCEYSKLLFGCTRGSDAPLVFAYNQEGKTVFQQKFSSAAMYVCRSIPDTDQFVTSQTVASGDQKSYVAKVYNILDMQCSENVVEAPPQVIIIGHLNRISDIQTDDSNPSILLTTSFDKRARLWDLRRPSSPTIVFGSSSRHCSPYRTHSSQVHSGDIAALRNLVLTAGNDYCAKLWDIRRSNSPLVQYFLDDSAVIKIRFNKARGVDAPYGSVCAASTMRNFFIIDLSADGEQELPYKQVEQVKYSPTRDFVWVEQHGKQFVYSVQDFGVVAKYDVQDQ